jgi:KaiC/GvpD/RAD55 family RecA-like ATPase
MPESRRGYSKIKTYVQGLDERLEGGIPKGHIVLICGTSGSMKTSFAFNIIYNAVKDLNINGIYISLEQSRQSIVNHMAKLGMDMEDEAAKSNLAIIDLGRLRRQMQIKEFEENVNLLGSLRNEIEVYKQKYDFDILVLDSLDALYALTNFRNPRNELFHFSETLRELGITTFLISEMERESPKFARYGVESFLSDGIIHLDMRRTKDVVNMYIGVVKMRAIKHDRNYYPLLIDGSRFKIVPK